MQRPTRKYHDALSTEEEEQRFAELIATKEIDGLTREWAYFSYFRKLYQTLAPETRIEILVKAIKSTKLYSPFYLQTLAQEDIAILKGTYERLPINLQEHSAEIINRRTYSHRLMRLKARILMLDPLYLNPVIPVRIGDVTTYIPEGNYEVTLSRDVNKFTQLWCEDLRFRKYFRSLDLERKITVLFKAITQCRLVHFQKYISQEDDIELLQKINDLLPAFSNENPEILLHRSVYNQRVIKIRYRLLELSRVKNKEAQPITQPEVIPAAAQSPFTLFPPYADHGAELFNIPDETCLDDLDITFTPRQSG